MAGTITTTSVGELLKRLYAPWDIEQLVNLTYPVLGECAKKGSAQLGGAGFYFPVRQESAEGHAYISEDQDLPTGRETAVKQAVVSPTVFAGVVQLTGLSMAVSSGNAMAFARTFDENVQATIESMMAYKEGVFFRDGTGLLATFVDAPDGGTTELELSDVAYIREGMYVDIIDANDDTRHDVDLKVTEVNWVTKKVTFTSAPAAAGAAGDKIYIAGSQDASGAEKVKEPIGLNGALSDTGTYLGLDRSTVSNWRSSVITANTFLDETILMQARTRLTQETGLPLAALGRKLKVVTHPQQVDVLFKLAIPRIRFTGNEKYDLGYSDEVAFGNIPFKTSYQCPIDQAYIGDFTKFQSLYTPNGELHIDTEYNGSTLKWVATKDVGLVFLKEYCAFAAKNPQCFVRINSLSTLSR